MIFYMRKYLQGIVRVRLQGKQVKRYLKLCVNQDYEIWNIVNIDNSTYECSISSTNLIKSKSALRKTKTSFKILNKSGGPRWLYFWKRHLLLLFFIIAFLAAFFEGKHRIWRIHIEGNTITSSQAILKTLDSYDVSIGIRKSSINCEKLEKALRLSFDDVMWTSLYISKSCLFVDIKEAQYSSDTLTSNHEEPTNIYAKCDATITSIIIRRGTACVKKGDQVKKGDLLVKGDCPIYDDNLNVSTHLYVDSDADIFGYVMHDYSDIIDTKRIKKVYEKNSIHKFLLECGKYRLVFPKHNKESKDYLSISSYKRVKINNENYLPIRFGIFKYYSTKSVEEYIDEETARNISANRINLFIHELELDGIEIISKEIKMQKKDSQYLTYGKICTCELIGAKDEFK